MRRTLAALALAAMLAALASSNAGASGSAERLRPLPCPRCWHPPARIRWQWQLSGRLELSVRARLYDVDMVETRRRQVRALHRRGRRVLCYVSAGSWENWRPDAGDYPRRLLGRPLEGWPGERWVDIRSRALRPILDRRIASCREKGFDGIELDNVDGYENRTGFPLTAREQRRFDAWLARDAHRHRLTVALKNDVDQARRLEPFFDLALDEECFRYHECGRLRPFVAAGKPVLEVEYGHALPAGRCAKARRLGFSAIEKHLQLGPWRLACPARSLPRLAARG